jgi:DNA replication and repair protein RecF
VVALRRLWLRELRCYEELDFEPSAGVTLVIGDNGQGKTSLLEAVSWLAHGRSFRGVPDAALVRVGAAAAIIRAQVERSGHERLVEVELAPGGRTRIRVNGTKVARVRALADTLTATVFAPDDLQLVKGGPQERRDYLDELLAVLAPRYDAACRDLERVLRHRNALLKSGLRTADDTATLEVWDAQLAQVSGVVVDGRLRLLARLAGPLGEAYTALALGERAEPTAEGPSERPPEGPSGGRVVTEHYQSEWFAPDVASIEPGPGRVTALAEALSATLEALRAREIDRGVTLAGPQRDEWELAVSGLPARTHASQGEQRSLALALRLAGHAVVTAVTGEPPVLLLDDVFSELDPHRSAALVRHLPVGQAIVTTAGLLPPGLTAHRTVRVAGGRLVA